MEFDQYVPDFQALDIFFPRYRAAFTPPAARKPDTACLALETITKFLKAFLTHLAATSLEETAIWGVIMPTKPIFFVSYTPNYIMIRTHRHSELIT